MLDHSTLPIPLATQLGFFNIQNQRRYRYMASSTAIVILVTRTVDGSSQISRFGILQSIVCDRHNQEPGHNPLSRGACLFPIPPAPESLLDDICVYVPNQTEPAPTHLPPSPRRVRQERVEARCIWSKITVVCAADGMLFCLL